MRSIYITESTIDEHSIAIIVDGVIDDNSLLTLKKVCQSHLANQMKVSLNLKGTQYISSKARDYIRKIENQVQLENVPMFIQL